MRLMVVTLLLAASVASALDFSADGVFYRGAEIQKVDGDALVIMHKDGTARIPYEKLPTYLQREHFDPAKVAEYRAKVAAEAKKAQERAAQLAQQKVAEAQKAKLAEDERVAAEERETLRAQAAKRDADAKAARDVAAAAAGGFGFLALMCLLGLMFYFLPALVGRKKANFGAIFVLNLLLGWTFIGWVVALVWACTKDAERA